MSSQSTAIEAYGAKREDIDLVRRAVLSDAYLWCRLVCQHTELSPLFHKPLAYLLDGDARRLVALLNDTAFCERSYPAREIKNVLTLRHQVDWNSHAGFRRLLELLDFVSLVAYRGSAKSTLGHDIDALAITRDPDAHTLIVSASDDRAMSFNKQIRDIINSPLYRLLFPDRYPDDPKDMTESQVRLKGRTLGKSPQPSLEARGYTARIVGAHYRIFSVDDLLVDTNVFDVDGVNSFLAAMPGLYEPRRIRRRHLGTVYHERGDNHTLAKNLNCLQVIIPVEVYPGAVQPDDISLRGEPTNPDWHDRERIAALYQDVISSTEGPRSWRMNFLLDPNAGGGAVFPAAIVDDRVWVWRTNQKNERVIGIPTYEGANRARDAAGDFIYRDVAPRALFLVIGADQAISTAQSADEWSVAVLGTEPGGVQLVLETIHGHDLEQMLIAIQVLDEKYTKLGLRIRVIGLEKAGFQGATKKWVDSDPRFRSIRSRILDIPHSGKAKEIVLQNALAEPMKSKRLFTAAEDPGCRDGREQAKDFKPFVKNRRDDILDSWAIAAATARTPARQDVIEKQNRAALLRYQQQVDPVTGLYLGY